MEVLRQFNKNVFFNLISFGVVGSAGIIINSAILNLYGASTLGKYSLAYAFLLILSQFAVGGVQFSTLRYSSIPEYHSQIGSIIGSGICLTTISGCFVVFWVALYTQKLANTFSVSEFSETLICLTPSFVFYAWNKVFIMAVNGLNKMSAFAVLNGTRYPLILLYLCIFYTLRIPQNRITLILTCAEATLSIIFLTFFKSSNVDFRFDKSWLDKHSRFGLKGLWGGALQEANTRVDILMIGVFLSDKSVGIYSFASMLAEGFAQLFIIVKNNVDPYYISIIKNGGYLGIKNLIRGIRRRYVPILALIWSILICLYPFICSTLLRLDDILVMESWPIFNILSSFIFISSIYKPFVGLLSQIGRPGAYSIIILLCTLINIILNFILIKQIGVIGAAVSTGVVFFIESYLVVKIAMKTLQSDLLKVGKTIH